MESAPFPAQRFARLDVPGWTVIDDTYNANPLSASRMIEAAAELAKGRTFVCVMGAMGELGDVAAAVIVTKMEGDLNSEPYVEGAD